MKKITLTFTMLTLALVVLSQSYLTPSSAKLHKLIRTNSYNFKKVMGIKRGMDKRPMFHNLSRNMNPSSSVSSTIGIERNSGVQELINQIIAELRNRINEEMRRMPSTHKCLTRNAPVSCFL